MAFGTVHDQIERIHGSRCWAKTTRDGAPGISVRDHCLNVGCVAEVLVERLLPMLACELPAGTITLVAAHDVGKLSPGFQVKCASWIALYGTGRFPTIEEGCRAMVRRKAIIEPDSSRTELYESDVYPRYRALYGALKAVRDARVNG
jgi:hypothetical protein